MVSSIYGTINNPNLDRFLDSQIDAIFKICPNLEGRDRLLIANIMRECVEWGRNDMASYVVDMVNKESSSGYAYE